MSNFQIPGKTAISSVDGSADTLLIYDASAVALRKTTRNTLLNITSQPVGLADIQAPTNKTFDNTNIFTIRDDRLTLQDNADTTKQAVFQLSGITTGTTRTYTLPNASGTLVDTGSTQSVTGVKTFTSPVLNTPTITNPTVTVDTISEYTAANGVTIDGVKLKDGALATNNSVVTANITDANVTPAKLVSGTGSSWAMQSWSPTWTNLSVGNGTVTTAYIQSGKIVYFRLKLVFGATTSISGSVDFTVPVNSNAAYQGGESAIIGYAKYLDAGSASYSGYVQLTSGSATKGTLIVPNVGGTYPTGAGLSSTVPFTFALSDEIHAVGWYEVA